MNANAQINNRVETENNLIGQLFLQEDNLERDLNAGFISFEDYKQEINKIYHNISDLYGFTS